MFCIFVAVALAAPTLAVASTSARPIAVVALTFDELSTTFGGQATEEGVVTTIGDIAGYGSGVGVAGTVNAGIAFTTLSSTVLTTVSGVGAVVSSYNIAQNIFDTVGVQIANDVYDVLSGLGVSDSGRVIGSTWAVSDLLYLSDLTFSTEVVEWIDDWYCGSQGCMCDTDSDCNVDMACDQWGYCDEYYLVYD